MIRRFLMSSGTNLIQDVPEIIVENNKIYYTSSSGTSITPYSTTVFGANIVSNTYVDSVGKYVIEFDGNVTQAGSNAFRSRSALITVQLPNTVTSIGERAFYYCTSLTDANLGEGLTTIGASAFSTCESLVTVRFGGPITKINQYAFYGCSNLTEVYVNCTTVPSGGYSMFEGISDTCKIYVPVGLAESYKSASYWSNYADMINEYNF